MNEEGAPLCRSHENITDAFHDIDLDDPGAFGDAGDNSTEIDATSPAPLDLLAQINSDLDKSSLLFGQKIEKKHTQKTTSSNLQRATRGDRDAMLAAGNELIETGIDFASGKEWLKLAAKKGSLRAAYNLASALIFPPKGFPPNYRKAARWLARAHKNGHKAALDFMATSGEILLTQQDATNTVKAGGRYLIESAAVLDYAPAQRLMGILHTKEEESGAESSNKESQRWFKLAADNDDTVACATLGIHYLEHAEEASPDYQKGLDYLWKAAKTTLSAPFSDEENTRKALEYAFIVANSGRKEAFKLARGAAANFAYNTNGYPRDIEESFIWLSNLVGLGDTDSIAYMTTIAEHILKGKNGLTQDPSLGVTCYKKAAKAGSVTALYQLGLILTAKTPGLSEKDIDINKGVIFLHQAADDYEDPKSMLLLGDIYKTGIDGFVEPSQSKHDYYSGMAKVNGFHNLTLQSQYEKISAK